MILLILAVSVVFVTAQRPHPCESPKQFEGRLSYFDRERKLAIFGKFAYDDINRRYRDFEFIQMGSKQQFYTKLYLYNEGFQYTVNLRTKVCNKTKITWPFQPYAVPPEANFRGTSVVGVSNVGMEHVTVNVFDWKIKDEYLVYAITTGEDCYPVSFNFLNRKTGHSDHRAMYDVSLGISDPEAFIPPKGCPP